MVQTGSLRVTQFQSTGQDQSAALEPTTAWTAARLGSTAWSKTQHKHAQRNSSQDQRLSLHSEDKQPISEP